MTVHVMTGPTHDCDRDGHLIAVRIKKDLDMVDFTPVCQVCDLIFLPSWRSTHTSWTRWLLSMVAQAREGKEATPAMYNALFDDGQEKDTGTTENRD